MLKALELAGFKSFADRTRFDFPDGITVVVGPNGSGKSNIVDAIKWVLGSQSAKSLRGKEMADVIFKGSQTRKAAGTAEATIIFDNVDGNLPVDAEEVRVTRRVYRSGEAEYLINDQPVRLKDVKDLIRGTGIGIDAYSLIEQGKVDRMLQANAKDRRAIFEEAAGISRFKAKKIEAERRLARVQTNLTRLGDIVDEVAARLKSIRSQASKAERYRVATTRLKELRTQVAWTDWTSMTNEFQTAETDLATAISTLAEQVAARDQMTQQRQAADLQLQEIAEEARAAEDVRAQGMQRIAELAGRKDADQAAIVDLRTSVAKSLRRVRLLQTQAGSAAAELRGANERLAQYESELQAVRQRAQEVEAERDKFQAEVDDVLTRRDEVQRNHLAAVRSVADLDSTKQASESRVAEAARLLVSLGKRIASAKSLLSEAGAESEKARKRVEELDTQIARFAKEIELADAKLQESRRTLTRRTEEQSSLNVSLERVTERMKVLDDLQRRQEGVGGGVKTILQQLGDSSHELSSNLHGIVADCISADTSVAPLIDAALGERTQYVVVSGNELQDSILDGRLTIDSRVGLIRIDDLPRRRPGDRIRLDGLKGVIGRGDRLVQCDEKYEALTKHLLSNTWLVDSLETALGLRKLSGAGLRFVTSAGELLESDGTTVVGPAGASTGLVSRRSELNSAEEELGHYKFQISEGDAELERLTEVVDEQANDLGRLEKQHRSLITDRAAATAELRHTHERLQARELVRNEIATEIALATTDRDSANQQCGLLSNQINEARHNIETLELAAADSDEMLSETQSALQAATSHVMSVSVDVARAEQKFEALQATMLQQQRDQGQREAAVADVRAQVTSGKQRIAELTARILDATNQLATFHWDAQQSQQAIAVLAQNAADVRQSNRDIMKAADVAIKAASKASESVHSISARRDSVALRRDTLADRLFEDYEIDLRSGDTPEEWEAPENREEVEEEITRLRSQLQKTSSVNMEALEELEGLQERYDELHTQYQDLTAAKDSLQRIIGRINADSRRLFLDTLEAIRQNFQKLYRKSFGGGHADLVLEEGVDPLEAGVDIVATPPGKPSFDNSLLSGGEKALTAVALLMSIFQYRPSPFCVLDEVDAPFDEANIGRFVTVLSEFLDHSKFVVVTHSKKTMTAATTLYGVTMQESGVSKQVSIRFDDVSDTGEISEGEAA
ncbi:chromosome segregation protein SMC [Planctomycetes bacterium K23_9]|uniref:Chromosome partition protein Smc n=1 Tax=Stieleria marina TaxID=1930275 RepID=A0A517NV90_9BACT|nr:Chromosome partition protein Smc [Planctomycetes bacterium K23_9]